MVVEEGQLKGSFKGFKNRERIFQFRAGGIWRQNEYKYNYYYAYSPNAKVIQDRGALRLYVDGMDDSVEVVRIR